jgi:prepilin-type N-terminal cleavage/methylation domain-containing protein
MENKRLKNGFTLIELLVAVLIIGILAAIALPQYQRAVWKSRATQLQQSVRDLTTAQDAYFLIHGSYPTNFDELDFSFDSLPDKPNSSLSNGWTVPSINAIRANDNMQIIINNKPDTGFVFSTGVFHKGKYKDCGFLFSLDASRSWARVGKRKFYCVEFNFSPAGDFCNKVVGISSAPETINSVRFYSVN